MIEIGGRHELAADLLESMHVFRSDVFVGRLGWTLPLLQGGERDEYDNDSTVYFVVKDATGNITACTRIVPTTSRYGMSELFTHLLGAHPAPCDPATWELSRFAASVRHSGEGRALALSDPTLYLLGAVLDYSRKHDVTRLMLVTRVAIERLLLRSGIDAHRMSAPCQATDGLIVALYIEV